MKAGRKIRTAAYLAYILMTLVQIVLIAGFIGTQYADYNEYTEFAIRAVRNGTLFYPVRDDLYTWYLHAPGYVNYLILILRLFGSMTTVFVINAVCIHVILFSCRYLVGKISGSDRASNLFMLIFCVYFMIGMNAGTVQANTELVFGALLFLAMALLYDDSIVSALVAGILLALSNWIRPIVLIFIPVCVWIVFRTDKRRKMRLAFAAFSLAATVFIIGSVGKSICGRFVYQSTITGINLLIGNNPDADGNNTYDALDKNGIGYLDEEETADWTYDMFQEYWKGLAIDWMVHKPGKVISLIPRKMAYQWAIDTYWCSAYGDNLALTDKGSYFVQIKDKAVSGGLGSLSLMDVMTVVHEIIYVMTLLLFAVSLLFGIKKGNPIRYWGLYSVLVLGIGMNCIMAGCGRFHFAYMPVMIMISSICLIEKYGGENAGDNTGSRDGQEA